MANDSKRNKIIGGVLLSLLVLGIVVAVMFLSLDKKDKEHHYLPKTHFVHGDIKENRLQSDAINLHHYDMKIHTHLDEKVPRFNGRIRIDFHVSEELNFILMHAHALNVSSATLLDSKIFVVKVVVDDKKEMLRLELDGKISGECSLVLEYSRVLSSDLDGFYVSTYQDENGNKKRIASTQFEAVSARRAFPCFDEPKMKATFQLMMIRPKQYLTLYNTKRLEKSDRDWFSEKYNSSSEGVDIFPKTPRMSSYLNAFVIAEFVNISSTVGDTQVRLFTTKEHINQTHWALEMASKLLPYFSQRFKLDFPITKLDLAAIPDFAAGAMENWGLITFRMNRLIEKFPTEEKQLFDIAITIAHEIAHQWFGDLVTMSEWGDLWLNEGFATYFSKSGMNSVFPEWKVFNRMIASDILPALHIDCYLSTHPIAVKNSTKNIFDVISYKKGSSFLRMVELQHINKLEAKHSVNPFTWGIRRYLKDNQYKAITTNDMSTSIQRGINHKLDKLPKDYKETPLLLDSWIYTPGYPVITVSGIGTTDITFEQSLFALDASIYPDEYKKKSVNFEIPIKFKVSNKKNYDLVMREKKISVKVADTTDFLVNEHFSGFYRVNYGKYWSEIIKSLKSNHQKYDEVERAMLIDDAFMLKRGNFMDEQVALDLVSYMSKETSLTAWNALTYNLKHMIRMLYPETKLYNLFRKYILKIMENVIKQVNKPTLNSNDKILQNLIYEQAVILKYEGTVKKCIAKFQAFKLDPKNNYNTIGGDIRQAVYTAATQSSLDNTKFLWKRLLNSQDAGENEIILKSISNSGQTEFIKSTVFPAIENKLIRAGNIKHLLLDMARNANSKLIVWEYLKKGNNRKMLSRKYLGRVYVASAKNCHTEEEFKEIKDVLGKGEDQYIYNNQYDVVMSHLDINKQWIANNIQKLNDYFKT